jgi:protein tyrosine/serine phosphatase
MFAWFLLLALPAQAKITDNFHVVYAGELYRSAQLSAATLEKKINQYGIKTVINLRGESPGNAWYEREAATVEKAGAMLVNIRFTAGRIPTAAELTSLLAALTSAPRPILVHCEAGADRTGEAVGIYIFDKTGDRAAARRALSPAYFHFEFTHPAMDYFVGEVYQGAQWAMSYDPCKADYKYFDRAHLCKVR